MPAPMPAPIPTPMPAPIPGAPTPGLPTPGAPTPGRPAIGAAGSCDGRLPPAGSVEGRAPPPLRKSAAAPPRPKFPPPADGAGRTPRCVDEVVQIAGGRSPPGANVRVDRRQHCRFPAALHRRFRRSGGWRRHCQRPWQVAPWRAGRPLRVARGRWASAAGDRRRTSAARRGPGCHRWPRPAAWSRAASAAAELHRRRHVLRRRGRGLQDRHGSIATKPQTSTARQCASYSHPFL